MNKLGMVLGVAAVCAIAGCKDPNYQRKMSKDDVKDVGATTDVEAPVASPDGGEATVVEAKCTCPPGTVHENKPCGCGAPDCSCVVIYTTGKDGKGEVKKPVAPVAPVEPMYTVYIVQHGDYLAKISKKYNVTINSIKQLNGLKDDKIRLGQKLKLPGKIDIGEQSVPEGAIAKVKKAEKKPYAAYAGATTEYVVKSGDTLGAIAYGHGITIRQLKELNALSSDALKIGQKLKVPAEKAAKAKETPEAKKQAADVKAAPEVVEQPVDKVEAPVVEQPAESPAVVETPAETVVGPTHTVQEGEELTDISIRWGVSAAVVRELNNLEEDAKLVPGQVLKLPADAQQ